MFIVGVDTAKDAIYGRLRIKKPGPGYVHFPAEDGFDDAYFDQLTAEQVVTRYREGRPYRVWVLQKGRRNEVLDTFVLALAAMKSLPMRLDRIIADAQPHDLQGPSPAVPVLGAGRAMDAPEPGQQQQVRRRPEPRHGAGWLGPTRGWLK